MPIYINQDGIVVIHLGSGDILPNPLTSREDSLYNTLAFSRLEKAKEVGRRCQRDEIIDTPVVVTFDKI